MSEYDDTAALTARDAGAELVQRGARVAAAWRRVLGNLDDPDVALCVDDLMARGSVFRPLGPNDADQLRHVAGAHDLACYLLDQAGHTRKPGALMKRRADTRPDHARGHASTEKTDGED